MKGSRVKALDSGAECIMAPSGNTAGLRKDSLATAAEQVQGRQMGCCSLSSGPWGEGALLLDTPGRSSHILAS